MSSCQLVVMQAALIFASIKTYSPLPIRRLTVETAPITRVSDDVIHPQLLVYLFIDTFYFAQK